MPFPLIPLAVAAVSAIGQRLLNRRAEKKSTQDSLKANMELAKYQFDANKEQIQLQNEYNSPLAQMSRFSEAGLNPNLIYGQGSSGNQQTAAQFQAPRADYKFSALQIPDMIAQYQNFQARQVDLDKNRSQIDLLNQKVRTESVNRMNKLLQGERGKFDLGLAQELRKYNVDIRGQENVQSQLKSKMLAKEFALLDEFGSAERKSRLRSQALEQARSVAQTATEKEKLDLMKTFEWTKGYQESAAREAKNLSAQQQAIFDQLKTTMFRDRDMTPTDNFFLRMLVQWLDGEGLAPQDILGDSGKAFPPR